jgi:zinc protease
MTSFLRVAAMALLSAFLFTAAPAQAQRTEPLWPHIGSDLKPDPAIKYGVLPNGMRYAIMRNTQPAGIASLRLRFGAGAMGESERTRGIAHFLEHMAFNGSQNVPEGEMVKLLQREGLAFGPDTNAYTSFGETVYMLDLPDTDAQTLDTGLKIMRETASRLLLAQDAIERERGVILSEERRRDSPEYRALKARFEFLLKGQPLVTRWPIGVPETIRSVSSADFRAFYDANYRPENALFVVVGDIDPAQLESKIGTLFADWQPVGAAAPEPSYGAIARRGPSASHYTEAGMPSGLGITWVTPFVEEKDTVARTKRDITRSLAYAVVNRRLERIARQADAPFISADISRSELESSAVLASLDISHRPGQWRTAMSAAEQELRRALRFGVTQAEVDREVSEFAAGFQAAAESAATRDTRSLAGAIPAAFDSGDVLVHPSDNLAIFNEAKASFTAPRVSAALREVFRGQGPLIFATSPDPIEGGDAALLEAYKASVRTPVTRPTAQAETSFVYTDFGPEGVVAERTKNAEFDVDLIRFANGVRLTLKKTPFQEKQINVNVRLRGGLATAETPPGLSILSSFVMNEAGLGKMTTEELERALAGRIVGASFGFGEDDLTYSGGTRAEDLALQMQVLAAAVTDPGFRPDGLVRIQQAAENFIRQYSTAPDRVLDRDAGAILRSGDARWRFPTLAQVQALNMDAFRAAIAPTLATAPIEITVVGDFDAEAAIKAVAQTFGALPARAEPPAPPARTIRFPAGAPAPIQLTHEGRADQAGAFIAWPAVDFSDPRKARAVRLARLIFENRLTEEYRENLAATYSPQTDEDLSLVFPGYGYIAATVETPPADIAKFFATVDKIAAELREGKIDDDTIERARRPNVDQLKTSERGNGYWMAVLSDAQSNPRRFALMRTRISDMEAITKAEIIAAARATFDNAKAVRIVVTPQAK